MNKNKLSLLTFLGTAVFGTIVYARGTYAVCPLCTIAVGAGLGISRWLGIDDSVMGVWVGGLLISMGMWFSTFIITKGALKNTHATLLAFGISFATIFLTLWLGGFLGVPHNSLWGVDKILLGTAFGMVAFWASVRLDAALRKSNGNKVYIYYQKVLLPVAFLSLTSYIMYLITE
jgi:hypothetical protein